MEYTIKLPDDFDAKAGDEITIRFGTGTIGKSPKVNDKFEDGSKKPDIEAYGKEITVCECGHVGGEKIYLENKVVCPVCKRVRNRYRGENTKDKNDKEELRKTVERVTAIHPDYGLVISVQRFKDLLNLIIDRL